MTLPNADPNARDRVQTPTDRRLNSWKAIGAFFERDERTVRRWETERRLPVHRVPGTGRSSVYAYASELAAWLKTADAQSLLTEVEPPAEPDAGEPPRVSTVSPPEAVSPVQSPRLSRRFLRPEFLLYAAVFLLMVTLSVVGFRRYFFSRAAVAGAVSAHSKSPLNPEAQDLYLQGVYHWNKRTEPDLRKALDEFTQSIVRDPNYAPAYVGLANCYNLLREYSLMPADEAYPRAIAAAQRAIALDDSLAEAHNSLAFAEFYWSWDAPAAEREFRRAIELDPNFALAHHWYATFLMVLGRSQEALAEIEQARKLDPQSSAILADKALVLLSANREKEAIALLKRLENSDPAFLSPHAYLSAIYLNLRDDMNYLQEAKKTATMLHDQDRLAVAAAGEKGFGSARGPGMLRGMLGVQQQLYDHGKIEAYELASTHCLLGDKQLALDLLKTSVDKREARVIAIRIDHNLQTLHDDPSFRKLIVQIGLPPL